MDTQPNLNASKTYIRHFGRHMSALCTFNIGCASTGIPFVTIRKLILPENSSS